ncbi:DUF1508 domain-containing protein [Stenotrophomonas rhizophila]|uniref:YegP family protein n=1 Tax=Stenotrophomonas rhizophila TaxID=216778 RepID=UPI00201CB3CB|nr:DUF1508 domain-containing protein [Stenotrophomonas rhizophila]UQY89264.1 DUF1508 domain-containing protein [Stenotrophomonas rhizophila]
MTGHPKQFVVYKDGAGEYRWRLYAQNSKIIADSAEGYKNKADCVHGAKLVSSIASGAFIWDGDEKVVIN